MAISQKYISELHNAAEVVKRGGIILYPTDTVWGIGCDATDAEAVAKIYELKRRADSKSMLSLVASPEMLSEWVETVPEAAAEMVRDSDRPLTIIYDTPTGIAGNLLADDGSLGIRIAADEFCRALCRECGVPVVSTSANISGRPTPRFFCEIEDEIKKNVDYIVDYRRDDLSSVPPSKIVKITDDGQITVIRE